MGLSNSVHLRRGGDEASDGGGAVTNAITSTKSDGSDAVTINIRRSNATKFAVQVSLESSVESFKSVIAKNCGIPVEQQHLVYKGWLLKDDRILNTYGMEAEHTVHLVGGLLPVESDNQANEIEDGTIVESGDSPSSTVDKSELQELERLQQRLFQNPNMMPETIYRLTKNPDSMWTRIVRSHELCGVIDNNRPDFDRLLYSPLVFRNLALAVVYFELIREMRRCSESGGGGSGGAPPVGLGGNEIKDPERTLDSAPDFDLISEIMENPHLMTIQNLLLHPKKTNRMPCQSPIDSDDEITENISVRNLFYNIDTMQQLMALQQSYCPEHCQTDDETDTEWEEWDFDV